MAGVALQHALQLPADPQPDDSQTVPMIRVITPRSARAALLSTCLLAAPAAAFQRAALPPVSQAIMNVALEPGDDGRRATLLLRDGRIAEVLAADASVPAGFLSLDGSELLCLPTFIDAYAPGMIETPEPHATQDDPLDVRGDVRIDMRQANRKGIQPAFEAHEVLEMSDKQLGAYRKAGFGYALCSPSGELLSGRSSLVALRDAAVRDAVIAPTVASHAAFRASGPGYPSTLMGYHAQLRQFFSDAQHHAALEQRQAEGRPGARPAFDAELVAGRALLAGELLVAEGEGQAAIRRWLRLGDELGLNLALSRGREAWELADVLAERATPLMLTLDWGDEPDDPRPKDEDEDEDEESDSDETADESDDDESEDDDAEEDADDDNARFVYEQPYAVRLERRLEWERNRNGAIALAEVGATFAFTTGDDKPSELLGRVRTLIEEGLPREAALRAMTSTPAGLLGLGDSAGAIEPGRVASLALWTADPLTDKKAKVAHLFVEGYPWKPAPKGEGDDDENDDNRTDNEEVR